MYKLLIIIHIFNIAADTETIAMKWCVAIRDYLIYRNRELFFEKLNGIVNNDIYPFSYIFNFNYMNIIIN